MVLNAPGSGLEQLLALVKEQLLQMTEGGMSSGWTPELESGDLGLFSTPRSFARCFKQIASLCLG